MTDYFDDVLDEEPTGSLVRWMDRPPMQVGAAALSGAVAGAFLLGAVTSALLWELSRHVLVWYFATLSQIGTVYGSLTTAIAVLLSLEIAATLLLLGAQVIAEYERTGDCDPSARPEPFTTEEV